MFPSLYPCRWQLQGPADVLPYMAAVRGPGVDLVGGSKVTPYAATPETMAENPDVYELNP